MLSRFMNSELITKSVAKDHHFLIFPKYFAEADNKTFISEDNDHCSKLLLGI